MKSFPFGRFFLFLLMGLVLLSSPKAMAANDLIELPDEELAKESVYPVFIPSLATKNRNIVTDKKFDLNVFYGWALTEPIANVSKLGGTLYYHTNEDSAWGLLLAKNFIGVSNYAKQLNSEWRLDFSRAPAPEMTAMVDYNRKFFYGKMSLTKKTVFNLHLYSSLMGGVVKYVHKTYPAVALGLGQKFYFSKSWGLRFDLRLFAHNAPVPFLGNDKLKVDSPRPEFSDFSERLTYTTVLDVGLSYLF